MNPAARFDEPTGPRVRPVLAGRPTAPVLSMVTASLTAVADRPALFAERFYARLYERSPRIRALFPADLGPQRDRLAGALLQAIETAASAAPTALAGFEDALARLGARHAIRYGVTAAHYPLVGDALVQAARDVAGMEWSTRTSSAWVAVYEWLAGHMLRGAAVAGDTSPIPAGLDRAVRQACTPDVQQRTVATHPDCPTQALPLVDAPAYEPPRMAPPLGPHPQSRARRLAPAGARR